MSWENIKSIIDGSRNFEKLMKLFKPTIGKTFKAIAFKVIFCGVMAWICLCPPFFYLLNPEYANDREYILHQIPAFVLISLLFCLLFLYDFILCINYYFFDRKTSLGIDTDGTMAYKKGEYKLLFSPADVEVIIYNNGKWPSSNLYYFTVILSSGDSINISSLVMTRRDWNEYIRSHDNKYRTRKHFFPLLREK